MLVNLGVGVFYPECSLVFLNSCFQHSAGLSNIYFITITTINLVNAICVFFNFPVIFQNANYIFECVGGFITQLDIKRFQNSAHAF